MSHIENKKSNYCGTKYNSQQYLLAYLSSISIAKKTTEQQKERRLNLNDFIQQKKKFKINNCFDKKESKKFLASKDMAMKEMELDDEIIDIKNNDNKSDDIKQETRRKKKIIKKDKFHSKKALSTDKLIRIKENKIKPNKTQKNLKNLTADIKKINNINGRNNQKINLFIFSKSTKELMENDDDIEVSSINDNSKNDKFYQKKNKDGKKENKKFNFISGNETFVNILSSLM